MTSLLSVSRVPVAPPNSTCSGRMPSFNLLPAAGIGPESENGTTVCLSSSTDTLIRPSSSGTAGQSMKFILGDPMKPPNPCL